MKTTLGLALYVGLAVPGPGGRIAAPVQEERAPERLEAWPELEKRARSSVGKEVQRLRKARTPAMGEEAHAALLELGAGAAPALLDALGKEKDGEARARIHGVLERITGAPHTRLLARSFDDPSEEVRVWCLRRASRFPDPGIREAAEAALDRVQVKDAEEEDERGDRRRDEPSPRERLAAALAATSSGSLDGLALLHDRAVEDWKSEGAELLAALEAVRGAAASERMVGYVDPGQRKATVAALRMLAGCGTKEDAVPAVRPYLDSDDASLRIAAINALRGIVDGEPPIEGLSVFDSIEEAGRWKARL